VATMLAFWFSSPPPKTRREHGAGHGPARLADDVSFRELGRTGGCRHIGVRIGPMRHPESISRTCKRVFGRRSPDESGATSAAAAAPPGLPKATGHSEDNLGVVEGDVGILERVASSPAAAHRSKDG
jgi:hypothetical protein